MHTCSKVVSVVDGKVREHLGSISDERLVQVQAKTLFLNRRLGLN